MLRSRALLAVPATASDEHGSSESGRGTPALIRRARFVLRVARWIGVALLGMAVLLVGTWCCLAVWFRCSGSEAVCVAVIGTIAVLALATLASLMTSRWRPAIAMYAVAIVVVFAWWSTIQPSNDRDWQPDVARNVTASIAGDRLVVDNVRNFNWRSDDDFDQRWEQRTYDLSQLRDVDLILSYWSGEAIAHLIVSFGFTDGQRLDFSIETRKERGEDYSTIAGFFKQYELVIIAADERDIVRVRSNVRGEDVRIYHLRMPPEYARRLLRGTSMTRMTSPESRAGIIPRPATARPWCSAWFVRSAPVCRSTTAFCYPAICPTTPMRSVPRIQASLLRSFANSRRFMTRQSRRMPILISRR